MSKQKKIVVGDCFAYESINSILIASKQHPPHPIHGNDMWDCQFVSVDRQNRWEDVAWPMDYPPLPTLHLPIKGGWFDMILSGVKKEEYRDIEGAKGTFRNCPIIWGVSQKSAADMWVRSMPDQFGWVELSFKERMGGENQRPWKVLHLTAGYDPNGKRGLPSPQLWAHIEGISIGRGKEEWGAPTDRDVFIIHLGDVFHTKNCLK